jgi:putative sigma-54 modulation protein
MNLTISGHHLEVTPALHGYVTGKFDRVLRHFDQVVEARVRLSVDNTQEKARRQKAECRIGVKGNDLYAESVHEDMYAAIDELADKLDRQVVRHKDKVQAHGREAARHLV